MQRAAVADGAPKFAIAIDIKSDEHAAWILERMDAIRNALKKVDDALKTYADKHDGGAIPIGGGKVWGGRDIATEWIATDLAIPIVRGVIIDRRPGGPTEHEHAMDRLAPRKITKTAIRREFGAAEARDIYDALREADALRVGSRKRYDVHRPAEADD